MLSPNVRIKGAYIYAFCALLSLFVYARAFDNPFRQDDLVFLQHVESHTFRDAIKPAVQFAFYRPGAIALFSLEHKVFARNSGAYLIFNYALHLAASVLMLLILLRIGLNGNFAFLASGLFLMGFGHYGKEVMWACASGPLTSVLLSLVSVLIALRWANLSRAGGKGSGRFGHGLHLVVVTVLLALAPLFHEASVVVCILVVLIVAASLRRSHSSLFNHAMLFLIPLLAWLAFWFLSAKPHSSFPVLERSLLNTPVYLVRYIGFMVVPVQRTAMVGASPTLDLVIGVSQYLHVVIGSAILMLLLYLVLKTRGTPRFLSGWFLLVLGPFTIVKMPDRWLELRYLYHASIPFCGLTAMSVSALWGRKRIVWKVIAGVVLVGMVVGSIVLQVMLEKRYDH